MSKAATTSRPAVIGGARLTYRYLPGIGTRLVEQWVRPPLHMTKAHNDQDWAISQIMSPTAGLLENDLLEIEATVAAGAKAALISPAACRVHTMGQGFARIRQHFVVADGGVLDVWPAPLILQKAAALKQETRVDVAADATLLLCEVISPGRAAYGEAFAFRNWTSRLRIFRDDKLLCYENFSCQPARGDIMDWKSQYPAGNYASLYLLSPQPIGDLVQELHNLETPQATIGASALRVGGLGVKILAADGISLRQTIFRVREQLITCSNLPFPKSLKRAQTFFH